MNEPEYASMAAVRNGRDTCATESSHSEQHKENQMKSRKLVTAAFVSLAVLAFALPVTAQQDTQSTTTTTTQTPSEPATQTTQTTETKEKTSRHHHKTKTKEKTKTTTTTAPASETQSTTTTTTTPPQQ
jgi:cytoskeletal protein RodZ